jgi:predicted nuclease of predicted toxin-antitoxin system
MLFHLDKNVDHSIARALRHRGIDVSTSTEAGLVGADDLEQLKFARTAGRVIFTQDSDFLRLHSQGLPHAEIVFATSGSRTVGEIVRFLCLLNDCMESHEIAGNVEFV